MNPDSTAILVGAIVMLVGVAWERRKLPMWTLAAAGVISAGVKFTSLLSVIVIAGCSSFARARSSTSANASGARHGAATPRRIAADVGRRMRRRNDAARGHSFIAVLSERGA